MRVWFWKKAISLPFPHQIKLASWNLVCTSRKNPQCALWWYWLFSLIEPPDSLKNVVSWSAFISPPQTKMIHSVRYWPKSLKFSQSAQFGGGLDINEWGWTWVKIQLCPNLREGMLRGRKRKIRPFLTQLIENQKLYNISKNQPPKSIRRGDMEISPLFYLKKVLFLLLLPPEWG